MDIRFNLVAKGKSFLTFAMNPGRGQAIRAVGFESVLINRDFTVTFTIHAERGVSLG